MAERTITVEDDDPRIEANEWHDHIGNGGVAITRGDTAILFVKMQPHEMDDLAGSLIKTAERIRAHRASGRRNSVAAS